MLQSNASVALLFVAVLSLFVVLWKVLPYVLDYWDDVQVYMIRRYRKYRQQNSNSKKEQ
jgi:hypothetical protein